MYILSISLFAHSIVCIVVQFNVTSSFFFVNNSQSVMDDGRIPKDPLYGQLAFCHWLQTTGTPHAQVQGCLQTRHKSVQH